MKESSITLESNRKQGWHPVGFLIGLILCCIFIFSQEYVSLGVITAGIIGVGIVLSVILSVEWGFYLLILTMLLLNEKIGIDINVIGKTTISVFDFLLILVMVSWLLKVLLGEKGISSMRYLIPVGLLWLFSIIGIYTAVQNGVALKPALWEVRPIFYYSLIFPIAYQCNTKPRIQRLIYVLIFGCFLVSLRDIAMYLNGQGLVASGSAGLTSSTLRVLSPELYISSYVAILAGGLFLFDKQFFRKTIYWVFLLAAFLPIVFSYTRNVWVGIGVSLVALFVISPLKIKIKFIIFILAVGIIGMIFTTSLSVFSSRYQKIDIGQIILNRLESISTAGVHSDLSSLQRLGEIKETLKNIQLHPIRGIGWGNTQYFFNYDNMLYLNTPYIHNGFLYIALKAGIPALLAYLWLAVSFLFLAYRTFKRTADPYLKGVSIGVIAAALGEFASSLFTEKVINYKVAAFLAILMGLVLAISLLPNSTETKS